LSFGIAEDQQKGARVILPPMSAFRQTGGPTEESIDRLLRQLEIGLPVQGLGLIDIPADLTRGDYLILLGAGIQTVDQLWQHPDKQLVQILGPLVGRLVSTKRPSSKSRQIIS
jgi:hypothetical protein